MSKIAVDHGIRGLAFTGGVVRGVAYPGALKALENTGVMPYVKYITGSSTGAIMASMIAIGASGSQLQALVLNADGKGIDLTKVFQPGKAGQSAIVGDLEAPWSILDHGGLSDGHYLRDFLAAQIAAVCPRYKIVTFEDLYRARAYEIQKFGASNLRELYVNVTNISTGYKEVFSHVTTPKLAIADAVRASASFPGALTPVRIGDSYYADGGIIDDFPVNEFDYERFINPYTTTPDKPVYNQQTLAFCFGCAEEIAAFTTGQRPPQVYKDITNDITLVKAFANAALNTSFVNLPREIGRTVIIDHLGIANLNTGMSSDDKQKLMNSAEQSTMKFISAKTRQLPDLVEYKNSSDESRVNIGGINTSLPAARSSSFATQVNADKAKKKEQDNTCCIL